MGLGRFGVVGGCRSIGQATILRYRGRIEGVGSKRKGSNGAESLQVWKVGVDRSIRR